jgi:uncharacterized coiled-coil protein SlyX
MKGMKLNKQASSKDRIKELEVALQNTQMALQVSQMMIKHITDQFKAVQNDVTNTMGMLNDFQYRTLAMLEVGNFDRQDIEQKAEALKLVDFDNASAKEDAQKGYIQDDAGVVGEGSVITITSHTPDLAEDQGIFRSKFPMSECLSPSLREKILGLKLNDTVEVDIGGIKHNITVLSIKKTQVAEEKLAEKES